MIKFTLRGLLLSSAAALLCIIPLASDAQGQNSVVIQGGTLVDVDNGTTVPNAVVVITGTRITAVGKAGHVRLPARKSSTPPANGSRRVWSMPRPTGTGNMAKAFSIGA